NLTSTIGIGHTRWATHGGVTVANAHPHLDCTGTIALIHNGIVENFQELKKELLAKGHQFKSETDTEIIVHLLEENLKAAVTFTQAMQQTFNALSGLNAVVALNSRTNEIIAAKNGSPLLVGIGDTPGEYFLASDATGIIKHTKKVIFLEDNQLVSLRGAVATKQSQDDGRDRHAPSSLAMTLYSLPDGKEITPHITTLDWDFTEAEKGTFPHFLLKEIHEQPKVIEHIALTYQTQTKQLAELIKKAYGTFMLGCGTASYAALAGVYLFSHIAKKHVNFSIGSEFNYLEDYITDRTLVIPISQSGETIDVVEPVQKAKAKGATIAALVNVLGSTIYRQADYKIVLGAGQEKAVVSTKAFMAMFSILLMTCYTLINKQKEAKDMLLAAGKDIKKVIAEKSVKEIKNVVNQLKKHEHIYLLGRGLSYVTALEAALKIKETACIHAEGFAGGELKHGVIALVEKGTPCIVMAPNDETYEEIISNAQEVKARGGLIIGIGPKNNPVFDHFLETADNQEATLLSQVAISQLLSYYLALARGIKDPDKPRNLAKSVTVK
ncbi:MAG TPA: glutamine--fructose-6-phosphate transaminase (isomerizing), partial [Patescibacteria group bacterium]|nr:glutamine--fructose-6-phosphate transaminase (isomerizing) [Patescibacteria group bacterium]